MTSPAPPGRPAAATEHGAAPRRDGFPGGELEQAFADIMELAALICDTPFVFVSIENEHGRTIKSKLEFDANAIAHDSSFGRAAMRLHEQMLVVPDASADSRFAADPLVTGEPHVRFYAAVPLMTRKEDTTTLCIIDRQPKQLTVARQSALQALQRRTTSALELAHITLDDAAGGKPVQMLGSHSNVSERKQIEAALHEANERLEVALQAGNVGLWEWDFVTNEVYFSPAWKRQLGYADQDMASRREEFLDRLHPDDLAPHRQRMKVFLKGGDSEYQAEYRLRHRDGSYRSILARGALARDAAAKPLHLCGAHVDITALKEAEHHAAASKYKSEFLAHVSHELRTPLNSLLVLSQILADNPLGNLRPKQIEYARTIHNSGQDLLNLINDILDLSKIEAGRMSVESEEVQFAALADYLHQTLAHVAESKGLALSVSQGTDLPPAVYTDSIRLQQVLRNLLSNAFKFTPEGRVELRIGVARGGWNPAHPILSQAQTVFAFAVIDTGIGIAPEKQKLIFEAFHQAESGTARRFGGTGLGLTISREIADLLGGEITLESMPGRGSTFTLYLPEAYIGSTNQPTFAAAINAGAGAALDDGTFEPALADDRRALDPEDKLLLIVEDDPVFARILFDVAHSRGLKGVITRNGAGALALAHQLKPTAITLDILLPDISGWRVLERLKLDPATRHIPVQVITVVEERHRALEIGALAVLVKPVTRPALEQAFEKIVGFAGSPVRSLLVVEDNDLERQTVVELLAGSDLAITQARTGAEALEALASQRFDCMVLDLRLPDMDGFALIAEMPQQFASLPIIVHTAKELTAEDEERLRGVSKSIVLKDGHSRERLLDETARFLHRAVEHLPPRQRETLETMHALDRPLAGRKVLLVDDDVRNLFALAAMLEGHHAIVLTAESGHEALDVLRQNADVAAVLTDVMMPEMNGYQLTRAIRAEAQFGELPIIALSAKAMPGDREQCLAAGCSAYMTKPVDQAALIQTLTGWLREARGG